MSLKMELFPGNCSVCYKRAIYYNYNCSACEPCKMYYRRSITKYCRYTCERNRKCYDGPPPLSYKDLNCKACRFYKCQKIGMHVNYETVPMLVIEKHGFVAETLRKLIRLDDKRFETLKKFFTLENPTLKQLVEKRGTNILTVKQKSVPELTVADWCFFYTYTTIVFLLNAAFMNDVENRDRVILLRENTVKTMLLLSSFNAISKRLERIVLPKGQNVFPEEIRKLFGNAPEFLEKVTGMLVRKLIPLKIAIEELLLIIAIFFCDSGESALPISEKSRMLMKSRHNKYCLDLLKYCHCASPDNFQTRYADLLGIQAVLQENFECIEYIALTIRIQMKLTGHKKLFNDIIL